MAEPTHSTPQEERQFHTYRTHRIPWYIRAMWIVFWIGAIWYLLALAVPMAKNYF
jgi:hypothetical protein